MMATGDKTIEQALRDAGVIPVITIEDAGNAVPLARTLVDAGLPVLEITLRTDAGLEAIRRIAAEVPDAIVGAGTLRREADIEAAIKAGSRFLVSPGTTPDLARAALAAPVPFLPGCATPSEAMRLAEMGFNLLKFFPASAYGGASTLKSLGAPLADITFVPTGGIDLENLDTYLRLPNVLAVGGSWMVRSDWIETQDYACIAAEARTASQAARNVRS